MIDLRIVSPSLGASPSRQALIFSLWDSEEKLKEFCKDKIAAYKQAKRIIIIDELNDLDEIPKGPTKKVLYRKLKVYYDKML